MVTGVLKGGKLNPHAPEFTLPGANLGAPPPRANGNGTAAVAPSPVVAHHPHGFKVDAPPIERSPSTASDKSTDTATPRVARDSTPPSPRDDPSSPLLQAKYRSRHGTDEYDDDGDDDHSSVSSLSSVYSLLPLRTLRRFHLIQFAFTFVLLFLVPVVLLVVYKREFRFWPFALGVVSWLAGETLREVVVELCTTEHVDAVARTDGEVELVRKKSTVLPAVVHSVAQEVLRVGAIYLVVALLPAVPPPPPPAPSSVLRRSPRDPLPPLDTLFWSAIFFSLGWAFVEIVWGSRGFWKQLDCYEDVLGPELEPERYLDEEERVQVLEGTGLLGASTNGRAEPDAGYGTCGNNESAFATTTTTTDRDEREMDDFEAKLREVQRDEIEQQLGVPLYEIPIFVTFIWRLDSILLSLVFTLFLSLPFRTTSPSLVAFPLVPTFVFVALVHAVLSALWVTKVKKTGIAAVSYASLVTLVGLTFASLGAWGVLR
ncbi:hypothetical protein JCM11491_003993 [Sporobolomyces phaffii]